MRSLRHLVREGVSVCHTSACVCVYEVEGWGEFHFKISRQVAENTPKSSLTLITFPIPNYIRVICVEATLS